MGVAAYYRGNLAISAQQCRASGCSGCVRCTSHAPTRRPSDWGAIAMEKAKKKADSIVSACARYGLEEPDEETLAMAVASSVRCGPATALAAARLALRREE